MIWRGLWVMWMRVSCAACVGTCWSAPSRRPVNTPTAAPASAAGSFITAPVPRTDCRWMWAASNHYTGLSTSLHMCLFLIIPTDPWTLPRHLTLSLTTGTCVMTWPGCRYAVWMQGRVVRWSAPWKAYTLMRTSASSPSCPAQTQVWTLTVGTSTRSFLCDYW